MTAEIFAAEAVKSVHTGTQAHTVQMGVGATLQDISHFHMAMSSARSASPLAPAAIQSDDPALKGVFKSLDSINGEAKELSAIAKASMTSGSTMSPGDTIMMTVRCQEFMFHCQLTSNIANRTSDGLQQLFRQQS